MLQPSPSTAKGKEYRAVCTCPCSYLLGPPESPGTGVEPLEEYKQNCKRALLVETKCHCQKQ